jgi:starch synthase
VNVPDHHSDQPLRDDKHLPKILIVTPEITYLPKGMGNLAQRMTAKAGGLADVSASLVHALHSQGARVHVALPNYARMFDLGMKERWQNAFDKVDRALPEQRIHLAEDAAFYRRSEVYNATENHNVALAFQREVINHIIPEVQPDLIHCNDWMTGLIPAVAQKHGIKCLFTVHNIHTEQLTLARIEDKGIDAEDFWTHCYFQGQPNSYQEMRTDNPVDLLTTGIFAADHVNSVSTTFLEEVIEGRHDFVPDHIGHELWQKSEAGCATGILNAPDSAFEPQTDPYLDHPYGPADHARGKRECKALLQKELGLHLDPNAPLFFWPSRLDPVQKGPQLLAEILRQITADYENVGLQIAIIANGSYQQSFHELVEKHDLNGRVVVVDFSEKRSHLGYAAADFMIMPSRFEPCGLPQMISPKYGTLTLAHDTGGIHDTVDHLNVDGNTGNGFLFETFDAAGLRWTIDEAIRFHQLPAGIRSAQLSRIMTESKERFNHERTARAYINRYTEMLGTKVTM